MDVGNDRSVFSEQGVEKGALSGVGRTCDCDRNTVLDCIAETEGIDESCDMADDLSEQLVES